MFCNYEADRIFKGYSNVSYIIDLKEVLPEWVRIGFSAASGPFFEKNFAIHSWQFDSDLDSPTEMVNKNQNRNNKTKVLTGAAGLSLLVLAGGIGYFLAKKRCKTVKKQIWKLCLGE